MLPTSNELLVAFAQMQALADARLVVRELLHAATLPADHPLHAAQEALAEGPLLRSCLHFHLVTLLGSLEAGYQNEVAARYASAYTQQFLRTAQRELRTYLVGAFQGLVPDEAQAAARASLVVVEGLLSEQMAAREQEDRA
jgi:hypothetical protein